MRARSCSFICTRTHSHNHTTRHTAQFTVETLPQRTSDWMPADFCYSVRPLYSVWAMYFYVCVCVSGVCARRMHDALYIHTHRQQFWIVYVRARHEQKQNAKATQGWRAVTTRRARWVRVVVVVVQKGRVSCWGLKRAQYSSTLFRVYRVCILCTCKQTDMHTQTHICTYIYKCLHAYVNTYIYTCGAGVYTPNRGLHTYIQTFVRVSIHKCRPWIRNGASSWLRPALRRCYVTPVQCSSRRAVLLAEPFCSWFHIKLLQLQPAFNNDVFLFPSWYAKNVVV